MSEALRKILVALDASAHSHAALREAAALAERLQAELSGIFIEDTELLRLSQLPVARETGLTSAARRALNPRDMERALKMQASQAQAALEATAKQHRLRSSFRRSRGNVAATLLDAAREVDLVALGMMGHMGVTGRRIGSTVRAVTAQATCSVLLLHPEARTGRAVLVAYGQSAGANAALGRAMELAARREADLVVVLCGSAEALPDLRGQAAQLLGNTPAKYDHVQADDLAGLSAAVGRHDGGLLVIPRDSELTKSPEALLRAIDCPVFLNQV